MQASCERRASERTRHPAAPSAVVAVSFPVQSLSLAICLCIFYVLSSLSGLSLAILFDRLFSTPDPLNEDRPSPPHQPSAVSSPLDQVKSSRSSSTRSSCPFFQAKLGSLREDPPPLLHLDRGRRTSSRPSQSSGKVSGSWDMTIFHLHCF